MKRNEAQYCRERVTHLGIIETFTLLGVHKASVCWGLVTQSKRRQDFGKGALLNHHQLMAMQEGNFLLNGNRKNIYSGVRDANISVQAIGATLTIQQ